MGGYLGHFFSLRVYFWSFLGFMGTLVLFKVFRVFWWPFGLGCIVDIFNAYGVFGSFAVVGGILVSQAFFWVCGVGWPSFSLKGISVVFKWILNYISSNFGFYLWFKGIMVFLKASMVFKLLFLLQRYFIHFLEGRCVSAIFWVCGVGWPSFSLRDIFSHF